MARLVKRLQGKPFQLIFSDNQNKGKATMMAYLKSKGFSDALGNFTLSQFAGHSAVKGNGHVPYYFVIDHTGKLVYDHMCGAFHGGDGMKCIEIVDELLKKAPAIYCGKEAFTEHKALAKKVESGKKIGTTLKALDKALEGATDAAKAELERLKKVVTAYRDRELKRVMALKATEPQKVLGELKRLAAKFKGTTLALDETYDALRKSAEHKKQVLIGKTFAKFKGWAEKQKNVKAAAVSLAGKLRKLMKDKEEWPICKTIEAWLKEHGA